MPAAWTKKAGVHCRKPSWEFSHSQLMEDREVTEPELHLGCISLPRSSHLLQGGVRCSQHMDPTQILPGPSTGSPQVALAPVQSSCEPAQLSRHPHGRHHQNQLGWGFPLLCLPTPNHPLPKHHRAITSISDHFQRSVVLFSWKLLRHKIGNGQTSR